MSKFIIEFYRVEQHKVLDVRSFGILTAIESHGKIQVDENKYHLSRQDKRLSPITTAPNSL